MIRRSDPIVDSHGIAFLDHPNDRRRLHGLVGTRHVFVNIADTIHPEIEFCCQFSRIADRLWLREASRYGVAHETVFLFKTQGLEVFIL